MEYQNVIIDEEVLKHIEAAMLLASAAGIMINLKEREHATHTKRYKELDKVESALIKLFNMYPMSDKFNLIDMGHQFYEEEHNSKLKKMIEMGVEVLPPSDEEVARCKALGIEAKPRAVFKERWKRGDVLQHGKTVVVIERFTGDEYYYVQGPALLYSRANHPKDPYMLFWKKIDSLGEDCTDDDIRESMYVLATRR
jgi:hypothetical protein